ncbi:SAM-dependent methyltransferase [Paenibacillus wulumuqiensis]|uniref:SAM-dependent methyltransferase n=1 Tax=Paenibacillus wulumuqiensis TaxID=1567107 RepID=UPI000619F359|nr:SAM-dependent methyltransferase [Paenibacillus wulumuqiensis]
MTDNNNPIYRFSEAPIWNLLWEYYEEEGLRAWSNDQVPQYVTSNPMIGDAYAEMIFGFLQDRANQGFGSEPVYIVELGAGAGRLAYHVIHELRELIEYAGIDIPDFCYVMTDLAMNNVTAWQQHPALQSFIQEGIVDFARFNAVEDTELQLAVSGKTIQPGDLKQPILIIANYFFDGIPQDLIYIGDGKVHEVDVAVQYPPSDGVLKASERISQIQLDYTYRHAPEYEQDDYPYRSVIAMYQEHLEDSHILFPAAAFTCLDRLNALSDAGFLLITADKGDHLMEKWQFADPPELVLHGSFSFTANYHAMQKVYEQRGAEVLFPTQHYSSINIGCILSLEQPVRYPNTRLAYRRCVERFGPDEFFSLKLWVDQHLDSLGLQQILSFWRLGGYDAEFFIQTTKQISSLMAEATDDEREDILSGIEAMWSSYYVMEHQHYDLALDIGLVLFEMDMYEQSKRYLEISVAQEKEEVVSTVYYCLAISCFELEQIEQGAEYLRKLLEVEPDHEEALALISHFESME